ncbi:TPA: GTP-binding protein [Candidatus Woesearchaeota archaeon]|nr:GTP-binding protein [Candidatus Woesearchaeota archaeon]
MVDYNEEIRALEEELSKTQYNKSTQHHIGLVKAKIARLKERAAARSKGGKKGEGYAVRKSGDATAILIGFPSVGKSTLLNKITNAESKTAAYAFTTLTCIPGMMEHKNAKIQVLDVPGILKGAASGLGRGKEVIAVARNADIAILMVDVFTVNQIDILRKELEEADIRVNQQQPSVTITRKDRGGLSIASTVKLTKIDEKTAKAILNEFQIVSADVVIREDITADQLIDVIEGNRRYMPALAVVNKIDSLTDEGTRQLQQQLKYNAVTAKSEDIILISAEKGINLDVLKDAIYNRMNFMRVHLKETGKKPDMDVPLIMKHNDTIRTVCEKLHRDFVAKFKFAKVWGKSAKFPGQKFKMDHKLADRDVVEIHLR